MEILPSSSTIGVGKIKFYDAIEPPLKTGNYQLSGTQTIDNVPNDNSDKPPSYTGAQALRVQGPQFSIQPNIVHAMYPAPMQTGSYDSDLPNVVLTDFALPWSRPIDPTNPEANPNTPWMGLLTIYPGEMDPSAGKIAGPKVVPVSELLQPNESNVLGPNIPAQNIDVPLDTKVTVVDMDFGMFQAISPQLEELPFLAHGREVNTGGKVILGMEGDGYFSLLISNRLPKAGTAQADAENFVFMVSYEGYSTYLRGGKTPPTGKTVIRLVLLSSWKFQVTQAEGSFLTLMADLCKQGRGGVELIQMPGANGDLADATAKEALQIGYVALPNDMRVGEKMTSWYRGPLVPAPTKRDFSYGPYLYSDHAMHYDPATGIFNHAYSAAWQIGRLLALSDASFAQAFFDWRNLYVNEIYRQQANSVVSQNAAMLSSNAASNRLEHQLQAMISSDFLNTDWHRIETRRQRVLGEHLPGVLNETTKAAIAENDEDPLSAILRLKELIQ